MPQSVGLSGATIALSGDPELRKIRLIFRQLDRL
jgi:hypothetical protein